jgi:osmotically-inducible protein OsmY
MEKAPMTEEKTLVAEPTQVIPADSRHHVGDVVEQARERLRAAPNISLRDLSCKYQHGLLILLGKVDSYYEKQLAQEAVARLEGVAQVVNQVEVTWGDPNLQRRSVR